MSKTIALRASLPGIPTVYHLWTAGDPEQAAMRLADRGPSWALFPHQIQLLDWLRNTLPATCTIRVIDEAHIFDRAMRLIDDSGTRPPLLINPRHGLAWQSSIHRFQSARNASPQKPNWRLRPTLQSSTRSGTAFMDRSLPRSHAPLSYLCSLVPLEEKETPTPPAPLLVDRPPPKKASAIQATRSRASCLCTRAR